MSWALFTVIQIATFALIALTALGVRNHRLRRSNEQLLSLCARAHEELVNVTGQLNTIEAAVPAEKMLQQRVKTLVGDDPVVTMQRLVLENEISPTPEFPERVMERMTPEPEALPPEEEFIRRWRSTREECQQLAMFLVADQPECLPAIRQLFEIIEPLDRAYRIELPPLEILREVDAEAEDPEAAETAPADVVDAPAERTGTG